MKQLEFTDHELLHLWTAVEVRCAALEEDWAFRDTVDTRRRLAECKALLAKLKAAALA